MGSCQRCGGRGQIGVFEGGGWLGQTCPLCGGSGDTESEKSQCSRCDGKGRIGIFEGGDFLGETCPKCGGDGYV